MQGGILLTSLVARGNLVLGFKDGEALPGEISSGLNRRFFGGMAFKRAEIPRKVSSGYDEVPA